MSNVIDRRIFFTELTKYNQEERMIAEMQGEPIEPTTYQTGKDGFKLSAAEKDEEYKDIDDNMKGFRIFTPNENYKDVMYEDYPLDDI